MAGKRKKNNPGLEIGGNVNVTHGDFIAGDKNIKVDKGGVYVGGNVKDSNLVTGDQDQIVNLTAKRDVLFKDLTRKIEQRPDTSTEDKEDLKTNVAEIKAEAGKGEQADESFLRSRLRNIERIAPDIADVVLATISNPAAGFAMIVKKVADRAQKKPST